MVVSVSRRCDIPRFAFNWFLERLDEGFVDVINPFNAKQTRRVSLESVDLFAFWTRDPAFILEHSDNLEKRGRGFFVMTTITGYPAILEPNAPQIDAVIATMEKLAKKITPDRIIWRYDPIFISNFTDYEFHRNNFAGLAGRLNGIVNKVIVSVYDEYPKAQKRIAKLMSGGLKPLAHYNEDGTLLSSVRDLLACLAKSAHDNGMEIQSCAEEDLSDCGIPPGACIDAVYIAKVFGLNGPGRDRSQRKRCLCAQSVDIGSYGSCPAGCVYCYGNIKQ